MWITTLEQVFCPHNVGLPRLCRGGLAPHREMETLPKEMMDGGCQVQQMISCLPHRSFLSQVRSLRLRMVVCPRLTSWKGAR
jgi:hypothetical protein